MQKAIPSKADTAEKPDWYDQADPDVQNEVFFVTAASILNAEDNVKGPALRDPSLISKEEFQAALFDSVSRPIYDQARGGRPATVMPQLDVYVGVKEPHKSRPQKEHHHAVLKLWKGHHRFLPFKRAMRERHGIATHWSTSHKQMWSAVRYIYITTPTKPMVDRAPLVWTRDNRKFELARNCNQPFQAEAWNRLRELRMADPYEKKTQKARDRSETVTKLDFSALVLEQRLRTPNAVLEYVMQKGSKSMQLYVCNRQRKLKELIQDAFTMESAPDLAAAERESDWERVERLARGTCKCGSGGCIWWSLAADFFKNNQEIDQERLAGSIRKVIQMGPSKHARVPTIIGEPNCAKSTVLDNVRNVFGPENVLNKPKLGAPNGALSQLAKGNFRFVFWDDFRPVEYAAYPTENPTVPVTDFLAFFQGQPFNIQVSQSFNDGHPTMTWQRGVAMTCKEEGLWDPAGIVSREEIKHMKARVEIFRATHVVAKSPDLFEESPACAESWCRWLLTASVAYASRERPMGLIKPTRKPLPLPPLPGVSSAQNDGVACRVLPLEQTAAIERNRKAALQKKAAREADAIHAAELAREADVMRAVQLYEAFNEEDPFLGEGM